MVINETCPSSFGSLDRDSCFWPDTCEQQPNRGEQTGRSHLLQRRPGKPDVMASFLADNYIQHNPRFVKFNENPITLAVNKDFWKQSRVALSDLRLRQIRLRPQLPRLLSVLCS